MTKSTSSVNAVGDMQVLPTGGALGAEVKGLDLRYPLPAETVQRVRQALLARTCEPGIGESVKPK